MPQGLLPLLPEDPGPAGRHLADRLSGVLLLISLVASWTHSDLRTEFPLQDPVRLQSWLRNMGRENWTPSRHQYICHQHFSPSCFRVRWGVRYLQSDAVPTVFQEGEKQKATDHSERMSKCLRENRSQDFESSDGTTSLDPVGMQSSLHTVHLFAVDQPAQTTFLELSGIREPDGSLQTDLDSQRTLYQTDGLSEDTESPEVVVMSQCSPGDPQDGITAAILNQSGTLVLNGSILGCTDELTASQSVQDVTHTNGDLSQVSVGQEVIAYFETIPNVFSTETSTQLAVSPDTVLSSALSSQPISSTLPIVSNHIPPSSLVLSLEEGEGQEDDELEGQQLEEHRYHKSSLSKQQLEAIVAELQKKVKVLQQRHRRHLEKLVGLENTVMQLRQSNLLNEERLQLLERAFIQASAAVPDVGETVAIIYEDDDTAFLYPPTTDAETMLSVE